MEPSDSFERVYLGYYGYPHYWNNSGLWGTGNHAGLLADNDWNDLPLEVIEAPGDIHLHSSAIRCTSADTLLVWDDSMA